MSLFRSETMGYYNLIMPKESALEILDALGTRSLLQFVEQKEDSTFKKAFTSYVKRCDELLIKLEFIKSEINRSGKLISPIQDISIFFHNLSIEQNNSNLSHTIFFERKEAEILKKYNFLVDQIKHFDDITSKLEKLLGYRMVLLYTQESFSLSSFFVDAKPLEQKTIIERKVTRSMSSDIRPFNFGNVKLNYVAGILNREDCQNFKRILFRVTKGNVLTLTENVTEKSLPKNYFLYNKEKILDKVMFLLIFMGGEQAILRNKMIKVCDSFNAIRFDIPETQQNFITKLDEIENHISDAENVYFLTKNELENYLETMSTFEKNCNYSLIEHYRTYILKEKLLYQNMNRLKENNHVYRGECWSPKESEETIYETLQEIGKKNKQIVTGQLQETHLDKNMSPPTFFRLNEFTIVFQEIVNTYGIPRYKEVNPGLFTIILFPFLFGIMFGDIGHGFLLFLFGIYLIMINDKIKDTNSSMIAFLPFRYLISLMGFFACYSGFIYNDMMSIPLDFGSCYELNGKALKDKYSEDCVYPLGVDPVWANSSNELIYYNSLKMKMAVIVGVIQMIFGIILKGVNNFNDMKALDFFFEFIPQIGLMISLFGYMIGLIIIKWLTKWSDYGTHTAPSIITTMINFPLKLGGTDGHPIWGEEDGERDFQQILLVIAFASCLIMLTVKPFALGLINAFSGHASSVTSSGHHVLNDEDEEILEKSNKKNSSHENLPFGELMIYQAIETIEFTLGTISNTASYLRLWALSLAHSQLSQVFFEKILKKPIQDGNFIAIIISFFIFANISFGVLMCMDAMECFLHALRLQWVEWQGKFYKADGYLYQPFSYEVSIKGK